MGLSLSLAVCQVVVTVCLCLNRSLSDGGESSISKRSKPHSFFLSHYSTVLYNCPVCTAWWIRLNTISKHICDMTSVKQRRHMDTEGKVQRSWSEVESMTPSHLLDLPLSHASSVPTHIPQVTLRLDTILGCCYSKQKQKQSQCLCLVLSHGTHPCS